MRRELPKELEHLGLDGHIEGRGRLVGDKQLRSESESHRDHDTLAHSARELMREALKTCLRPRDANHLEQLDCTRSGLRRRRLPMRLDGLDHLLLDREDRVQAGHRILEDHRDVRPADASKLLLPEYDQVLTLEHDPTSFDPAGRLGQEADYGEVRDALTAARLANKPEALTLVDLECDAVHGMDRPVVRPKPYNEVLDRQECHD